MNVLGMYGSPREGGNTDILLSEALRAAGEAGAHVTSLRVCGLDISGCTECGGCEETGECVIQDDMQSLYPRFEDADAILLAAPVFFYAVPAQVKAVIDRCQAMWCRRMLRKSGAERKRHDSGAGYLLAVGATQGANLFEGLKLEVRYWLDALDMRFEGGVYVSGVDAKGAVDARPESLQDAFELGRRVALGSVRRGSRIV